MRTPLRPNKSLLNLVALTVRDLRPLVDCPILHRLLVSACVAKNNVVVAPVLGDSPCGMLWAETPATYIDAASMAITHPATSVFDFAVPGANCERVLHIIQFVYLCQRQFDSTRPLAHIASLACRPAQNDSELSLRKILSTGDTLRPLYLSSEVYATYRGMSTLVYDSWYAKWYFPN